MYAGLRRGLRIIVIQSGHFLSVMSGLVRQLCMGEKNGLRFPPSFAHYWTMPEDRCAERLALLEVVDAAFARACEARIDLLGAKQHSVDLIPYQRFYDLLKERNMTLSLRSLSTRHSMDAEAPKKGRSLGGIPPVHQKLTHYCGFERLPGL